MPTSSNRKPEITLPATALSALRDALSGIVGPEAAADALRAAGHASGDALYELLTASQDLAELPAPTFWERLGQLFSSRGWGHLRYSEAHPGVGALDARDWAEAVGGVASEQPNCHFTTGVLANLLGRVAGAELAVLEVKCRGRGDDRCRFLFGGAAAVYAVYERLAAGESADTALQQIR